MIEVKAFIRSHKVDEVIQALENQGVTDLTVLDVMGIGEDMVARDHAKYSVALVQKYSKIAKLEIVCEDEDSEPIISTIRKTAYTGRSGDGMIYTAEVRSVYKIRSRSHENREGNHNVSEK